MTPFETFFAGEFQRRLNTVRGEPGLFSNGGRIEDASWDRKAAYLLWTLGRDDSPTDNDILGLGPATLDEDEDLIG